MTKLNKLVNIFLDPVAVFEELRENKDWIFPLIIVLIAALISSLLIYNVITSDEFMEEIQREMEAEMPAGQEMDMSYMNIVYFFSTVLLGLLVTVGAYLVLGFFLWLFGKFVGRDIPFSRTFSATIYIGIVGALGSILTAILVFFQKDPEAVINLALIFPNLEGVVGTISEQLNIFGLWQAILFALAVSVFYRLARWKSLVIVIGIWALFKIAYYFTLAQFLSF